jgi:hypothetical protein
LTADVAVALRVYPGISKSPFISGRTKLDLVTLGLESFVRALGGCSPELLVLLDGCPPEYQLRIRDVVGHLKPTFVPLTMAGNRGSFLAQLDVLLGSKAPVVYFAEDDYVYLPGAFDRGFSLFREGEWADYATLYDHPDVYEGSLHRYQSEIRIAAGCHWRSVASTCLTFFARRDALVRDRRVFETFARGNYDVSVWMSLTRLPAVGVSSAVRAAMQGDTVSLKALAKVARFGLGRWLFGPRRQLWSALPSLATHMESSRLAPGVDWDAHFNRVGEST